MNDKINEMKAICVFCGAQNAVPKEHLDMAKLLGTGWRVGIVWECAVRQRGEQTVVAELATWLGRQGKQSDSEIVFSGLTSDLFAN